MAHTVCQVNLVIKYRKLTLTGKLTVRKKGCSSKTYTCFFVFAEPTQRIENSSQ